MNVLQGEQNIPLSCRLRVSVYGPLDVWQRDASGTWKLVEKEAWGKGRVARSVFKRLLTAPGRRLSRTVIQDDLWPESENFDLADRTIYGAVNQIRRVTSKALLRTVEASYELADQSMIWVDSDECAALLKEAENRGCTSIQALPLLEQALAYMERGELLEGESGIWVYGLRKKSEDMLRQCRMWLTQAYESQGKLWQAGEQYRALCTTLPPDEDALQQWMEMLQRQGRQHEALECYQDVTNTWATQGYSTPGALQDVIIPEQERMRRVEVEMPVFQYTRSNDSSTSSAQSSNRELLKDMIDRNFPQGVTYNLLSSNIKTMNFRDEWQYIVNNLVSETKIGLRAMVFDVELTRWWNSIAGQIYMMTNMELLRKHIPLRRIFILSSLDARLRMNALMNAYVHHKIGIDVKVCTVTGFQNSVPFKPDMFSVHDNLFVALYYFSPARAITNLLLEDKYIVEFCSFYDELFQDEKLCVDIESILTHINYGESFWAATKMQLSLLQRLEKIGSTLELARNPLL